MTAFDRLPAQAVLPLGARRPDALRRRAEQAGHRWLQADCAGARDKAGVMAALARGFGLPDWFGANLDALYDCVTDLEPGQGASGAGLALLVEHLPDGPSFDAAQRDALLDVFRDAADHFAARGIAFRVFHSVGRGAPSAPR
jgi:RNAse (barnase) inhibitor barstar